MHLMMSVNTISSDEAAFKVSIRNKNCISTEKNPRVVNILCFTGIVSCHINFVRICCYLQTACIYKTMFSVINQTRILPVYIKKSLPKNNQCMQALNLPTFSETESRSSYHNIPILFTEWQSYEIGSFNFRLFINVFVVNPKSNHKNEASAQYFF